MESEDVVPPRDAAASANRSELQAEDVIIPLKDTTIAAKIWGPIDGEPWLAFHGWLDNANTFDFLVHHLPPNIRLISTDLAGHGRSSWRRGHRYCMEDYVADAYAVAKELGLLDREGGFVLMGHSLGAAVALMLAALVPDKCTRLVMVDGFGPHAGTDAAAPDLLLQSLTDTTPPVRPFADVTAAARRRVDRNLIGEITEEAAMVLCRRGCKPYEGAVVAVADTTATATATAAAAAGEVVWAADPVTRTTSRSRWNNVRVCAFMRRIACPSLLLASSDGLYRRALAAPFNPLTHPWLGYAYVMAMYKSASLAAAVVRVLQRVAPRSASQLLDRLAARLRKVLIALTWGLHLNARASALRRLRVVDVGTGGHHVHLTQAAVVGGHIRAWLADADVDAE